MVLHVKQMPTVTLHIGDNGKLEGLSERDRRAYAKFLARIKCLGQSSLTFTWRPQASPDLAARWMALMDGIEAQDIEARLQARQIVLESFTRIVLWHRGDPPGVEDGEVFDLEITARGGGTVRLRVDRSTGGLVAD